MTIDIKNGELKAFSKALRSLPKPPSPSTAWRWRTVGVHVGGQRIRLDAVRVGGRWYTTDEAVGEFIQRQTEAALAQPESGDDSPSKRPEATERRLGEAGLLCPVQRDGSAR